MSELFPCILDLIRILPCLKPRRQCCRICVTHWSRKMCYFLQTHASPPFPHVGLVHVALMLEIIATSCAQNIAPGPVDGQVGWHRKNGNSPPPPPPMIVCVGGPQSSLFVQRLVRRNNHHPPTHHREARVGVVSVKKNLYTSPNLVCA